MWRTLIGDARRKVNSSTPHATLGRLAYESFHVVARSLLAIRFTVSTPQPGTQRCRV